MKILASERLSSRFSGVVFLSLLCSLTACNLLPLAEIHAFKLVNPSALNREVTAFQHIRITRGDETFSVQSALDVSDKQIKLVLLDPLGQRLATVFFDGDHLQVENNLWISSKFPLPYMIEVLQMIFWPLDTLQQPGWRLEQRVKAQDNWQGERRSVYKGERLIATIDYRSPSPWMGEAVYRNAANNYELHINTILLDRDS